MLGDCSPEIVKADTERAEDASARDENTFTHCRCRPSRELRLSREQGLIPEDTNRDDPEEGVSSLVLDRIATQQSPMGRLTRDRWDTQER